MSVSSVTSGVGAFMAYWRSEMQRGRQDFQQLSKALKSGDLAAAQQAFGDMRQFVPGFGASEAAGGPADAGVPAAGARTPAATREAIQSDVATLGTALQSGDLAGARSAFSQLQQDMQAPRGDRGHHYAYGHARHGGGAVVTSAPPGGTISVTPPATTAENVAKDTDGPDGTPTFHGIDLKA